MLIPALRKWYRRIRWPGLQEAETRLRNLSQDIRLSHAAKLERAHDRGGELPPDPGIDAVVDTCVDWLRHAQDSSLSQDGGVAAHYSLVTGWASSYPETTGYIVPTLLEYARRREDDDARNRARRMLDWLVSLQFDAGGYQGGHIGDLPRVPVSFNTGQILLGLAAGQREFGTYEEPLRRAADWLVATQDPDGCWRSHPSPFAATGDKAYDTHLAWGLLEADSIVADGRYTAAATANIRWALTHQHKDGFIGNCCLDDASRPLTHTLAYALRGIIEGYRVTADPEMLYAASLTADGLMRCLCDDGFLPGRLMPGWRAAVDWACLTGTAQTSCCWSMLYELTGDQRYLDAGRLANSFVRRTVPITGPPELRGGVKGSHPIDGNYKRYSFVSWAAKFCIDANLLESSFMSPRMVAPGPIHTDERGHPPNT